jgi:hypothetical protein
MARISGIKKEQKMNTRTRNTANDPILISLRPYLILWAMALLCVALAACGSGTTNSQNDSQSALATPGHASEIQPAARASGEILPPEFDS